MHKPAEKTDNYGEAELGRSVGHVSAKADKAGLADRSFFFFNFVGFSRSRLGLGRPQSLKILQFSFILENFELCHAKLQIHQK